MDFKIYRIQTHKFPTPKRNMCMNICFHRLSFVKCTTGNPGCLDSIQFELVIKDHKESSSILLITCGDGIYKHIERYGIQITFRCCCIHINTIFYCECSLVLPDRFFSFILGWEKRVWWTAYTIFVLQICSFCKLLIGHWLVLTKNKELFLQLSLAMSFTPIYKSL